MYIILKYLNIYFSLFKRKELSQINDIAH